MSDRVSANANFLGGTECPRSILLIEDEYRLRRTLARSLEARGFSVEEAATAAEAAAATRRSAHDLALLDVNLPDATGWELLRDLREQGWKTPVIVLSAVAPNPRRVREFQPHGVLLKPFPMDALLRLIRSGCGMDPAVEPDAPLAG
jgi:DNA-binding response OmpR family regulator